MKNAIEERKQYAKIIAQAWVDEDFKAKLLAEPATVLKEGGIEIPDGMTVKVVEQKENEIHIPLPAKPSNTTAEDDSELMDLTDEDVQTVTGGRAMNQAGFASQVVLMSQAIVAAKLEMQKAIGEAHRSMAKEFKKP